MEEKSGGMNFLSALRPSRADRFGSMLSMPGYAGIRI